MWKEIKQLIKFELTFRKKLKEIKKLEKNKNYLQAWKELNKLQEEIQSK